MFTHRSSMLETSFSWVHKVDLDSLTLNSSLVPVCPLLLHFKSPVPYGIHITHSSNVMMRA